ncbi:MAG: Rossmann-like and DUF2520 domain-containing protein [Gemmatimonadota bacterium]
MEELIFVGPGRVGLALGYALLQAEAVSSVVYYGRRPEPPAHPLFHQGLAEYRYGLDRPSERAAAVLLTVPDHVLPEVAVALAGRGAPRSGVAALHTSGVRGADLLEPLHRIGYSVGTLHPLQSVVNSVTGAERLVGAGYAISGDPTALIIARRIVSALSGRTISVPPHRRPLYHASAVLASNYLVVLLREAVRLFHEAGASREEAEAALLALARGTLENVAELGLDSALTGPVVRGDLETVHLHLRTLEPADAAFYSALGLRALHGARGELPSEVAGELEELLGRYL